MRRTTHNIGEGEGGKNPAASSVLTVLLSFSFFQFPDKSALRPIFPLCCVQTSAPVFDKVYR
jgi:hypothetical protein